jgi:hypothetical protein
MLEAIVQMAPYLLPLFKIACNKGIFMKLSFRSIITVFIVCGLINNHVQALSIGELVREESRVVLSLKEAGCPAQSFWISAT